MGGPNTHGDPAAWLAELASTVESLKARVSRGGSGQTRQGNTGTRNSVYPTPTTDEARVALANARITWFNTDTGWWERYFAVEGKADLDPECALISLGGKMTSGWYPVAGAMPTMTLYSAGAQSIDGPSNFTNWKQYGQDANSYRSSNLIAHEPNNAAIQVFLPGRYRVEAYMRFPNGNGTGVVYMYVRTGDTSADRAYIGQPVPLLSQYGQGMTFTLADIVMGSSDYAFVYSAAGQWSIGEAPSHFRVEYLGPALLTR